MSKPMELQFDEPHLAAAVERLPPEAVDTLAFGAIRLGPDGIVGFYSQAEGVLSGYGPRPSLGKNFFTDIAPCMNAPEFRGRIDTALAAGQFDLEFGWIGDFSDRQREVRVRVQPATDGGCWIFLNRGS